MLKIVYDVCCGIDIHKKFVVSCVEKFIINKYSVNQATYLL